MIPITHKDSELNIISTSGLIIMHNNGKLMQKTKKHKPKNLYTKQIIPIYLLK